MRKRTRRNPSISTILPIAALGGVAIWIVSQLGSSTSSGSTSTTSSTSTTTQKTFKAPNDLYDRMLNAWIAQGSPMDRNGWITAMQTVFDFPASVWGYVYDQNDGYHTRYGRWASESDLEHWLNTAAAQYYASISPGQA